MEFWSYAAPKPCTRHMQPAAPLALLTAVSLPRNCSSSSKTCPPPAGVTRTSACCWPRPTASSLPSRMPPITIRSELRPHGWGGALPARPAAGASELVLATHCLVAAQPCSHLPKRARHGLGLVGTGGLSFLRYQRKPGADPCFGDQIQVESHPCSGLGASLSNAHPQFLTWGSQEAAPPKWPAVQVPGRATGGLLRPTLKSKDSCLVKEQSED